LKEKTFYKNFDIRFAGINFGKTSINFKIDSFFMNYYDPTNENVFDLNLEFVLQKETEALFTLYFFFSGKIECSCDRCLNRYILPVNKEFKMYLKVESSLKTEEDDDILYVSPNEVFFNIADTIHDFTLMLIPVKSSCDLAGLECNQVMLKKINELSSNQKSYDEFNYGNDKNLN